MRRGHARNEQEARAEYRLLYHESYRTFKDFQRKRYPKGFSQKPRRPIGHHEDQYVIIDPRHAEHWPPEFHPQIRPFEETDRHRQEHRWSRFQRAVPPATVYHPPPHGAGHGPPPEWNMDEIGFL